mmetsp:Transcript_83289/g.258613  ORF Transcript_83289/g.258613 Transcript_83289/m.258613 type:complete len:387 (-) Transcript_83289:251-1411(-)
MSACSRRHPPGCIITSRRGSLPSTKWMGRRPAPCACVGQFGPGAGGPPGPPTGANPPMRVGVHAQGGCAAPWRARPPCWAAAGPTGNGGVGCGSGSPNGGGNGGWGCALAAQPGAPLCKRSPPGISKLSSMSLLSSSSEAPSGGLGVTALFLPLFGALCRLTMAQNPETQQRAMSMRIQLHHGIPLSLSSSIAPAAFGWLASEAGGATTDGDPIVPMPSSGSAARDTDALGAGDVAAGVEPGPAGIPVTPEVPASETGDCSPDAGSTVSRPASASAVSASLAPEIDGGEVDGEPTVPRPAGALLTPEGPAPGARDCAIDADPVVAIPAGNSDSASVARSALAAGGGMAVRDCIAPRPAFSGGPSCSTVKPGTMSQRKGSPSGIEST